jgi:LysM repeat protein
MQSLYVVQAGDTLKSIARRFHTSRWILADLNDLGDPGLIRAGQRLLIPRPGASALARAATEGRLPRAQVEPVEVEPGPFLTLVRPGDTLSAIAQRFGVTAAAILEANRLQDPESIQPGRPLLIPGAESQPETGTLPPPASEPASQELSPEPEPMPMPMSQPAPALPTGPPNGGKDAEPKLPPLASGQPGPPSESEELSSQYEYVVQPGDTLMAIARHFNVTVRAIIEANHIADVNWVQPGQRLVVPGASSPPGPGPAGEAEPGEVLPPQPDDAWDMP